MSTPPQKTTEDIPFSPSSQQHGSPSTRSSESSVKTPTKSSSDVQSSNNATQTDAVEPQQRTTPTQPPTSGNINHTTPAQLMNEPSQVFHKVQNRSIVLSFALSAISPILNFVYFFPSTKTMGVTFSLMMWILFGGMWCLGFAQVMAPFFLLVAKFILRLDVIPGLGTSLWVLLSTLLMVSVITDVSISGFPGFLNNLPLFSLIYANWVLLEEAFPHFLWQSPKLPLEKILRISYRTIKVGAFYFCNGKCVAKLFINNNDAMPIYFVALEKLSVPTEVFVAYEKIKDSTGLYIRGVNLDEFKKDFSNWREKICRMQRVFMMRRVLYLMGFLCESAAVFGCFYFLTWIDFSHNSHKTTMKESQSMVMLIFKILLQVMVCGLSEYFELLVRVEEGFTTPVEVLCMMVWRLASPLIDCSDEDSKYLSNGRKYGRPPWAYKYTGIRAKYLPLIGIVLDKDQSKERNKTVLRNIVTRKWLVCQPVEEGQVKVRLLADDEERQALASNIENVQLHEYDIVN